MHVSVPPLPSVYIWSDNSGKTTRAHMRPAVPLLNIDPFNYRYIGYSPTFMPPLPPSFSQPRRRSPRAIISPTLSAFYHKKTKVNKKSEFGLHEQTDRVELRTMYYMTRSFTVGTAEIGPIKVAPQRPASALRRSIVPDPKPAKVL